MKRLFENQLSFCLLVSFLTPVPCKHFSVIYLFLLLSLHEVSRSSSWVLLLYISFDKISSSEFFYVQINFWVNLPFHLIKPIGLSESIVLLLGYLGFSILIVYHLYFGIDLALWGITLLIIIAIFVYINIWGHVSFDYCFNFPFFLCLFFHLLVRTLEMLNRYDENNHSYF